MSVKFIKQFLRREHQGLSPDQQALLQFLRTGWLSVEEAIHLAEVEAFASL